MAEIKVETLQVRVTREFLALLDGFRRSEDDLPSRAEAIRRLVLAGIEAKTGKPVQAEKVAPKKRRSKASA